MNESTCPRVVREFYDNLKHLRESLQTEVRGTTITMTLQLLGEILKVLVEGLVLQKQANVKHKDIVYSKKFGLPKEYKGEKIPTYMDADNRRLYYTIAKSLLHKLNAPNSVPDLEHYII